MAARNWSARARRAMPRWLGLDALAVGLTLGVAGVGLVQGTAWCADSDLRVREDRLHEVYGVKSGRQYNRQDKASEERERDLPHSTFITRRWSDDTGTRKFELKFFLVTGSNVRIQETLETDYFTCHSTDKIEFRWGVDQREYVKFHESLGKCPDFTEESNYKWRGERVGKGAKPLEANHLITVETSTIKVTLDKDQWLRKGDKQILNSLSGDFASVATGDLVKLGQMGAMARLVCTELAGLYTLDCQGDSEVPELEQPRRIDCDFDASFGEPCSVEQQREFDTRKAKTSLPAPTAARAQP